jgi:hypothetical protein
MKTMDKKLILTAAGCLALAVASPRVFAERPPTSVKGGGTPGGGGTDAEFSDRAEEMLKKRQQDMIAMHDLMHRIRDAKDPQEKARLMEQHLQMLRDNWQEMRAHRRPRAALRRGGKSPDEAEAAGSPVGEDP